MKKMVLVFVLCSSVFATSRYVATTGEDSGEGTIDKPWRHIAFATHGGKAACSCKKVNRHKISAGDTLFIRGGTYHEHLIQIANTGIRGKNGRITIKSYPGEWAIIDAGSSQSVLEGQLWFALGIGVDHENNFITIDSLEVRNGYVCNFYVGWNYPDTGLLIKNCISRNHIFRSGGNCDGIGFIRNGAVDDTVRNCIIIGNNTNNGNYCGVQMMNANGITVENCDISHVCSGIHWKLRKISDKRPSFFINNWIHDNTGEGINLAHDRCLVQNNLITGNVNNAAMVLGYCCDNYGGSINRIIHNTCYNNRYGIIFYWHGSNSLDSIPEQVIGSHRDTTFDNIISANNREFGSYTIWPYANDTVFKHPPNHNSDYNLYWNTAKSNENVMEYGRTAMTLNAWKTLYPNSDKHSVWGLPKFANTSGTMTAIEDFRLEPSSPGYKAASDLKDIGADISLIKR